MLCCHLLRLTANKAREFELSKQPKVMLCDVRVFWCFTKRCRMELCQGSRSVKNDFLPPWLSKTSGCKREQRLCSLLLRTMRNLLGSDLVPVFSVSDSLIWAGKSERRLLEGWGGLLTEFLKNAGVIHDVWTRYMENQRIWRTPKLSVRSKMSSLLAPRETRHSNTNGLQTTGWVISPQ